MGITEDQYFEMFISMIRRTEDEYYLDRIFMAVFDRRLELILNKRECDQFDGNDECYNCGDDVCLK
jgi:hypothetical protein